MKAYLLSWLRKAHASATIAEFEQQRPGTWLVWEAGPWRPPTARQETLAAGPRTRLLAAGESLAILLEPRGTGPEVRIGRGADCDVVIDDATLSRVHLVLASVAGARWTVRDAASRNGTKLDGTPVGATAVPLQVGAVIEAGAVRLTFLDAGGLFLRLRAAP